MSLSRARTLHRCLLGSALVVKGLSWPQAPPAIAAALVLVGLIAISGRHPRIAFGVASVLIFVSIASESYVANHFILLGLLTAYATLIPAGDTASRGLGETLTMVQVSAVYFWAAAWKVNPEFLSGAVLHFEWFNSWLAGPSGVPVVVAQFASWCTIVAELILAAGLWWRRAIIPWILALGVTLHVGMILTIGADWYLTGSLIAFALTCGASVPFFLSRSELGAPSRARLRRPGRAATTAP